MCAKADHLVLVQARGHSKRRRVRSLESRVRPAKAKREPTPGFVDALFACWFFFSTLQLAIRPFEQGARRELCAGMALRLLLWAGVLPLYVYAFEAVPYLIRSTIASQTTGVTHDDWARSSATYALEAIRLGARSKRLASRSPAVYNT